MTVMIPVGRLTVATPETMALSIREGTVAATAVDERIAPVAAGIIASDPTVKAAAAGAVAGALTDADIAMRSDAGMPKRIVSPSIHAFNDAEGNKTFLDARATDGGPQPWAARLIARVLIEEGYTFGGGGGGGGSSAVVGPIVCLGDSLTDADAWLTSMAEDTSLVLRDLGEAGQSSTEVAFRSGALVVQMTVAGNTIPASGPVAVTALSPNGSWRTGVTVPWSEPGTLAGVRGVFRHQYTGNSGATFTRDEPGAAVACPAGTPFIVAPGPKTGVGFERLPAIIWVGRNNVADSGAVQRDITAMVGKFTNPKKLILSVTNMTTEPSGSTGYNQVIAINNWIAATYPNQYLDVRRWLIDKALAAMGLSPTGVDTTAISEDRIPPQLLSDSTHMTPAASAALGHYIARVWRERGL